VDGLKPENQNLKEKIAVLECELKDCVRKLSQSEDSCQKLRLDLKEQIQRSISADEMKTLLAMKETELADVRKT
jgi:hypothetical protein